MQMTYDKFAIMLHWLMALLIILMIIMGYQLDELSPEELANNLSWHSGTGVLLLILATIRLWWRYAHSPPPYPNSMSILKKRTAITVVHGFYFLMFLQPIVGLVQAMVYKSVEVRLFGVFGVGWLRELDKMWLDIFSMIHSIGAGALSLFVMFHLGAALKHRFIDRDEIMGRMSPFKRAHKSK